jgi:predicted dehydrogenase
MGRWHAHAIRRIGARLIGVADSESSRAAALARRHPGSRPFACLEEALAASPSFVHICTPLDSHVPLVRLALQAGAHVIAEKPLARTREETRALLDLAAGTGRLLVPVHQFPWQDGVQMLMERVSELEPIVHLEIATASAGARGLAAEGTDHVAGEILPHFLSLTRRLAVAPLPERDWIVTRPCPGEWRVGGRAGTVSIAYLISMAARPTFAELRLLGEQGSARADLFHGFATVERGGASRATKLIRPFRAAAQLLTAASLNLARRSARREPAYPGLIELVRQTYFAAMRGLPGPIPPDETEDVARVRDLLLALGTVST